MKKLYNVTLRGYYVMSVILGMLMAFAFAMALEVFVMDACLASSGATSDMLEEIWCYLPLGVCDLFSYRWQSVWMVTASIMTVGIFVRMTGSGKVRTKMLQTLAVAMFTVLLLMAYRWAMHSWTRNGVLALVPVLLMVIPLIILRNTQREVRRNGDKENELRIGDWLKKRVDMKITTHS